MDKDVKKGYVAGWIWIVLFFGITSGIVDTIYLVLTIIKKHCLSALTCLLPLASLVIIVFGVLQLAVVAERQESKDSIEQ